MKKVSANVIIDKIFRDFDLQDSDWKNDAYEWIGEAIEFIGHTAGFVPKSKILQIESHRALLPPDYHIVRPKGVIYQHQPLPYGRDGNRYEPSHAIEFLSAVQGDFPDMVRGLYGHPINTVRGNNEYYTLAGDSYLNTSFESGQVLLKYWAYATDDKGFPLVPDSVYYKEAIMWYVLKKMILRGYKHPEFNYDKANFYWKKACAAAANDAAYPTPDKMENFVKRWVRMLPNINFNYDSID